MTSRRGVAARGLLHVPRRRHAGRRARVMVLCHGMESTKEGTKHQALAARLAALGYLCLRFDFSYVGESEGRFEDLTISGEVEDLGGAIDFLTARGAGTFGSSARASAARSRRSRGGDPRVRAHGDDRSRVALPLGIVERMRPADVEAWRRHGGLHLDGGTWIRLRLPRRPRAGRRRSAAARRTGGGDARHARRGRSGRAGRRRARALRGAAGAEGARDHARVRPSLFRSAHLAALLDSTVEWMRRICRPDDRRDLRRAAAPTSAVPSASAAATPARAAGRSCVPAGSVASTILAWRTRVASRKRSGWSTRRAPTSVTTSRCPTRAASGTPPSPAARGSRRRTRAPGPTRAAPLPRATRSSASFVAERDDGSSRRWWRWRRSYWRASSSSRWSTSAP